ncbi:MAG: hypothetical protein KJZ87_20870, partial [Thermoguttaceae bacterium]|nr:hypothetical protein [Thermoguttaceae bacterium]
MRYVRLWIGLWLVIGVSFAVLGYYGREIYRQAPPIPERVMTTEGLVLFTGEDILDGQNVWQSLGGQQLGSIWGHGAYVAPDWSADWLHRECMYLLEHWSREEHQQAFAQQPADVQSQLKARLRQEIRTNTFDPQTKELYLSPLRAEAIDALGRYYAAIFGEAQEFPADIAWLADGGMTPGELRSAYAIPARTVRDAERQRKLNIFFFWAAWACGTERAAKPQAAFAAGFAPTTPAITYTNNWPAEALIDNRPSGSIVVWSVLSFVLLLAGIGA